MEGEISIIAELERKGDYKGERKTGGGWVEVGSCRQPPKWKMRPSAKSAHTRRKCKAGRGGSVVAPDGDGSKVTRFA